MPTGRNDPCPCGSGRKHKHCCARSRTPGETTEGTAAFPLPPDAARQARDAPRWEADLLPIPAVVQSEVGRPLISLVVTDEAILDGEISSHTTSDPAALARVLGDALSRAAARVGVWPPTVVLRHPEFSEVLVPELAERGAEVMLARRLEVLDEVALGMMSALTEGIPLLPPMAQVEAWAEWGLPTRMICLRDFSYRDLRPPARGVGVPVTPPSESGAPVISFPSGPGQRGKKGSWWCRRAVGGRGARGPRASTLMQEDLSTVLMDSLDPCGRPGGGWRGGCSSCGRSLVPS